MADGASGQGDQCAQIGRRDPDLAKHGEPQARLALGRLGRMTGQLLRHSGLKPGQACFQVGLGCQVAVAVAHRLHNALGLLALQPRRLEVVGYLECIDCFGHGPILPDQRNKTRNLEADEWVGIGAQQVVTRKHAEIGGDLLNIRLEPSRSIPS